MIRYAVVLFLIFLAVPVIDGRRSIVEDDVLRLPSNFLRPATTFVGGDDDDSVGTKWAVLIAGSNAYYNYRHQVI